MKHATVSALEILRAPPANRREALDLVLQDVPDARRADHITGLLAAADAGQIDLDGLFLARRDAEIVAAWAYLQPGRVASVWPAVARDAEPEVTADALLEKVTLWLAHSGTQVAQALLAVDARQQTAQMARAGFTHMADLLYMVCLAGSFPTARPESGLQFEPAGATELARLATVVERTYEQTLDCPQLNGVRDVHDVLAGYRASGVFAAERWLIVHESGREVGCLLLTDHAGDDQWEIVYAGLVPEGAVTAMVWRSRSMPRGWREARRGCPWCWPSMRPMRRLSRCTNAQASSFGTGALRCCAFFHAGGHNVRVEHSDRRDALAGQLREGMSMMFFCSRRGASVSADVIATCDGGFFFAPRRRRDSTIFPRRCAASRNFFRGMREPPAMRFSGTSRVPTAARDSRRAKTL